MTRGTYGIFKCEKNANIWGQGDAFFGDNHSFNETLFQQVCDPNRGTCAVSLTSAT